jgi:hypothetical protein
MTFAPIRVLAAVSIGLLLFITLITSAHAQSDDATVEGIVTDSSGAAVPGATVAVQNDATSVVRTVTSDGAGRYTVNSLTPGSYQIMTEAKGFNTRRLTGITLNVSSHTRVDVVLTVGQTTETVTVQASETMAETQTSSNGALIDNEKVVELPLANRQFYDLALLSPAAYQPAQNSTLGFRGGINVAGAAEVSNQFTLNGIYDNDIGTGQPSFRPSIEDIQEFKLLTGVYSAEYGRMSGGQVVVASKSGGNSFHGVFYEFIRNQVTDAKPYFTQEGGTNPAFKQNTFGATVGGPIRKDKTFFFYSYEGQRIRQQITSLATVPTPAMLAGCFNIPTQMYNPSNGKPLPFVTTGGCSGVPGGGYDVTSIVNGSGQPFFTSSGAKTGQLLASLGYPAPTSTTPLGAIPGNNYNFSETRQETMNENAVRVDHTISTKDSLIGTFNWFHDTAFEPSNSLCSALVLPNYGCFTGQLSALASLAETHIFSPGLLNEVRFGWERLNQPRQTQDNTTIGTKFPALPGAFNGTVPNNLGVPFTQIAGYSTFGGAPNLPQDRIDNHWQLVDEVTWNHGAHTVKAGVDLFKVLNTSFYVVGGRGQLTFNVATLQSANCTVNSAGTCVANNEGTTGYEIGDLLLGLPAQTTNSPTAPKAHNRYESYDLFVLDDWKATPYLTLNLGLRWEVDAPVHDAHDDLSNFSLAQGQFIGAGPTTYTRLYNYDYNNFAPRVGFAWQPLKKETTVVKGAFGVFYDQPLLYNNFYDFSLQYPQYNTQTFFAGAYAAGNSISLSQPFPSALLPAECLTQSQKNCSPTIYPYAVPANYRTPYFTEWSFGVQQAITKSLLFESTYFGTKGTKLAFNSNANQAQPNTFGAAQAQATRPFSNFQNIYYTNTQADSSYQSWQNSLKQNYTNGVSFLLAYTYAKSIDSGDIIGTYTDASSSSGLPQNSFSPRGDRGLSDFDVRQRLVFSPVAQLPFGTNKRYFSSGWGGKVASGWQVTGIVTWQTGRPFSVFNANAPNNSGSFSFVDRPNIVPGTNANSRDLVSGNKIHTPGEWFNIHAFTLAPAGQFGNEGRNSIIGPAYTDVDATISKSFHVTERVSGQFRVEGFNVLNHPQFLNPQPENAGNQFPQSAPGILPANYSGSFGSISQANNQRELQFGLRILY